MVVQQQARPDRCRIPLGQDKGRPGRHGPMKPCVQRQGIMQCYLATAAAVYTNDTWQADPQDHSGV